MCVKQPQLFGSQLWLFGSLLTQCPRIENPGTAAVVGPPVLHQHGITLGMQWPGWRKADGSNLTGAIELVVAGPGPALAVWGQRQGRVVGLGAWDSLGWWGEDRIAAHCSPAAVERISRQSRVWEGGGLDHGAIGGAPVTAWPREPGTGWGLGLRYISLCGAKTWQDQGKQSLQGLRPMHCSHRWWPLPQLCQKGKKASCSTV